MDLQPPVAAFELFAENLVEKRKRRSTGRRAAIVIGTIILLPDGSECRVEGFDAQGNPLCYPLQP
jgi:hypothetical protein